MIVVGWIVFSFVAGAVGNNRKIGFWGAFLLSLLLSPLIGLIIAFASPSNEPQRVKVVSSVKNDTSSVSDELTKLKKHLDDGVLTQEEFDGQKAKLLS